MRRQLVWRHRSGAAAILIIASALACGSSPPNPSPNPVSAPSLTVPPISRRTDAAAPADAGAPSTAGPRARPKYEGLVTEIEALLDAEGSREVSEEKFIFLTKGAFTELRALADPRAADALARLVAREPPLSPRWRSQALLALAELGDLRAVPALAWRLKQDPLKLYTFAKDADLKLDDTERVVSARYLADILAIHPDQREEITKTAEDSVLAWAERPGTQPHANAMRSLALMGTSRGRKKIRGWADPTEALPKEGQQMFPPAFATAQSALRCLGIAERISGGGGGGKAIKTESDDAWRLLDKQLFRKPEKADVTMEQLLQGGRAVLGMSLRALGVGASQGFAEIGDPRAGALLVRFIEDEKQNEQARVEAATALAWVADDALLATLATKVTSGLTTLTPKKELVRVSLLQTFVHRGSAKVAPALLPLVTKNASTELRITAALAMGMGGVDASLAKSLLPLLDDHDLRIPAGLALLLGADTATATATFARLENVDNVDDLKIHYINSFSFVSDRDHVEGHLAHRVQNAQACGGWAKQIAMRSLQGLSFDQGPHSLSRPVLRARLLADGRGTDVKKRGAARAILEALGEDASVDSLGAP